MGNRRRLSRRDFLRLGVCTATGAALAGCAPAEASPVATEESEVAPELAPTVDDVILTTDSNGALCPTKAEEAAGLGPKDEGEQALNMREEYCKVFVPASTAIAHWITRLQYIWVDGLPSYGAVRNHEPHPSLSESHVLVHPQRASSGLAGLLQYSDNWWLMQQLGRAQGHVLEVVERWISWYLSHLDRQATPPGIVWNHYYLLDGSDEITQTASIEPSSSDDTAAPTFLSLAWEYFRRGGDDQILKNHKDDIRMIAGVILHLQGLKDEVGNTDGLTFTKPSWKVKYLMDNCTVYRGLDDMAKLENHVFNDDPQPEVYQTAADKVKKAIQNEELDDEGTPVPGLYDQETGVYHGWKNNQGGVKFADCSEDLFLHFVALVYPELKGVIPPGSSIADDQWEEIEKCRPDWVNPESPLEDSTQLYPQLGYAALLHGDWGKAWAQTRHVIAERLPGLGSPDFPTPDDFRSPFHVESAGWLLRTLSLIHGCIR